MKKERTVFQTDKRYPGVRRRELETLNGYEKDYAYYIQYRDKTQNNKVVMAKLGNESEGWNYQKAYLEKETRKTLADQESLGIVPVVGDATIMEIWQDYMVYNDDRPETIKTQKFYMKKLKPFYKIRASQIMNRMIQDFRKNLEKETNTKGQHYAAQSIVHFMKQLKLLLNYGVKRELCSDNPNLKFEFPRINNQKIEFLTDEQVKAYLAALDEDKDVVGCMFLKIAFYTGMRKKAIINLQWEDIDFEQDRIILRGEVAKNHMTNYIPLPEKIKEELKIFPKVSKYIFPGKYGIAPREDFVRVARRIRDKVGLPKNFRPIYMLRHNFATHLACSGKVEIYTIQRLMTHQSPQMTQRYAHFMDKTLKDASKVIEELFNQ